MKFYKWIKGTIAGETKTGEIIHGILDANPIPNQMLVKAGKAWLQGDPRKAKRILAEALTIRNITALIASIAILTQVIPPEVISVVSEWLAEIMAGLNGV